MTNPHLFGDNLVDHADSIVADHVNNLRDWVRYVSALGLNSHSIVLPGGINPELTDEDKPVLFYNPAVTSHDVFLPPVSENNHAFYIGNTGDFDLNVKYETNVVTIVEPGAGAIVVSNGVIWIAFSTQVLDEDDFASNSPTGVPTQQSVKAYVDNGFAPKVQRVAAEIEVFNFNGTDPESIVLGDTAASLSIPYHLHGWILSRVYARVAVVPSGGPVTIQLNNGSNDLLSTQLTIDSGEYASFDAAVPAVINWSYSTVNGYGRIDIDIDAANGAKGLIIILEFTGSMD